MHKLTRAVLKQKLLPKKPPKQVTLMIESKLLQSETTKAGLYSQRASTKHLTYPTSQQKPSRLSKDPQHRKPSIYHLSPRPLSYSSNNSGDFSFHPRINSKSRSLSKRSQPRSCRHRNCAVQQHDSLAQPSSLTNYKYFEKLLYRVTSYFEENKVCWEFKNMTYGSVLILLNRLGYIQCIGEKEMFKNNYIDTLKKAYQFWQYLMNSATLENFFLLVCAIEKISIDPTEVTKAIGMFINYLCRKSVHFKIELPEQPDYRFIVSKSHQLIDGQIVLNSETKRKIAAQFREFRVNRLNRHMQTKKASQEKKEGLGISEKSSKLADKKRRKMIEIIRNRKPNVETVSLADILNFKQAKKNDFCRSASNESGLFHPHSNNPPPLFPSHRKIQLSSLQLQHLSRPKMVIERCRGDLQFQRVEHECTFQPVIHTARRFNQTTKIPNMDKSVDRMKEGRWVKKEKSRMIQTGWTNCKAVAKKTTQKENIPQKGLKPRAISSSSGNILKQVSSNVRNLLQTEVMPTFQQLKDHQVSLPNDQNFHHLPTTTASVELEQQISNLSEIKFIQTLPTLKTEEKQIRIPLLFIDVNIDETKKERIVIYDEDSSQKLAQEFARKHGLDAEMQDKLQELLQYQMSSILTKIEEEADDEDD